MTHAEGSAAPAPSPEGRTENAGLFRGVGKHALIYGLGMILSRAVSFLMLPVYTRYLTVADYGVMALVEMTLDFIAIVGGAQLALGVFRFYHKTDDPDAKRGVVSTTLLLVGALYTLVGAATFVSADPLSRLIFGSGEQVDVIRVAALNLTAGSFLIVPMAYARVRDLSTLFVTANLAKLVLAVAFNVLFIVVLDMGVIGIFLGSLVANSVVGGVLVVWLVRNVSSRFSRAWTGDLLRYGVPLMGMQVATFVATFSDRYFLQAFSDESVVGLYSLAYQFGFLLYMVGFTPFDMVWSPKRFEVARRPGYHETLSQGFLIMNVLLLTTAVGISLYVADVLRIMATPSFHPAARVVPLILIAYVLQGWATIHEIGVLIKEKTHYLTLANVGSALVAVVGYAILIPRYLEWGAAVATVFAFATRWVLTYVFSQRLWHVRYRWRPVLVLVIWSAAVCAAGLLLPALPIALSIGVRTAFVLVFALGLWLLPILRDEERVAVRQVGAAVLRWRPRG